MIRIGRTGHARYTLAALDIQKPFSADGAEEHAEQFLVTVVRDHVQVTVTGGKRRRRQPIFIWRTALEQIPI